MRFNISTLLLLVLVVALAIGWRLEHLNHEAELQSAIEAQELVGQTYAIVSQKRILERFPDQGTLPERVDRALINGVIFVYENASKIDALAKLKNKTYNASDVAKNLLSALKCESAESCLENLADHHKDVERFKVYNDSDSIERRRLKKFLELAIASDQ